MFNRKLNGKVTQAELDGDVFIGVELTPAQKKEASRRLAEIREKSKKEMTEEVRVSLIQYGMRGRIDDYIVTEKYDPAKSFGNFLKEYVDKIPTKRKDFAEQIGIDESLLSQLINGHRLPPDYMTIRLEIHSDNRIPAGHWYKLITMEKEHYIKTDQEIRKKQRKFVHNPLHDQKAVAGGKNGHAAAGAKNGRAAAGAKNGRAAASRVKAL
jgi:plasmid maintenance system antidote protein VapI